MLLFRQQLFGKSAVETSWLVGLDELVEGFGDAGDWESPGFLGGMGGGFPRSDLGIVGDLIPGDRGLKGLE